MLAGFDQRDSAALLSLILDGLMVGSLIAALSMHRRLLRPHAPIVAQRAKNLSAGLALMFGLVLLNSQVLQPNSRTSGFMVPGYSIGIVVWFIYFLIFVHKALTAAGRPTAKADVFD